MLVSSAEVLEIRSLLSGHAITGTLWNDLNADGLRNEAEAVLEGRTVYIDGNNNGLFDESELSATTDAVGEYRFSGLTTGTYIVRQLLPESWLASTLSQAAGELVSLTGGRDLVFDNARDVLYVTTDRGGVERIDLASGSKLTGYSVGVNLFGADITPDSSALYIAEGQAAGSQGVIHKINLGDGSLSSVRYTRESLESGAYDVAIGFNGKGLVTTQFAGSGWTPLRHLDSTTDTLTKETGVHGTVRQNTQIHRSGDGSLFFLMEANISSGPIFTYDVGTDSFPHSAETGSFVSSARAVLNYDGSLIATTIGGVSIMDSDLKAVENLSGVVESFAFDTTKNVFYALDKSETSNHQIVAFDTKTWEELYRFGVGESVAFGGAFGSGTMRVSEDGRYLTLITPSGVRIFDLIARTGGQTVTITGSTGATGVNFGSFAERIPEIRINDVIVVEGNSGSRTAVLTVSLSEPAHKSIRVNYATANGSASASSGDYTPTWGTLEFAPGETAKTLSVVVRSDAQDELDEQFAVNLMGASRAIITDVSGIVTIENDDAGSRGRIEGTLWNDFDADGVRDPIEDVLVGWTVYLDLNNNGQLDFGENNVATDENGQYSFSNLPGGEYTVAQLLPEGWLQTSHVGLTGVSGETFFLPWGSTSNLLYLYRDLVFDASRNHLLVTTASGTVERVDLNDMRLLEPLDVGNSLFGADITFDGKSLYVAEGVRGETQGIVRKVDLQSGAVTNLFYDLARGEVGAYDIAVGSEGRALVTTQFSGSGWVPLHQLNLATDTISTTVGPGIHGQLRQNTALHRSADGTGMLLLEANISSGPIHTYDAVTNTFPGHRDTNTFLSGVPGAVNRDGTLYAVGLSGLGIYDRSLRPLPAPVVADRTAGLAFHPTRDLLYRAGSTHITVYETEGFTEVSRFPIGETLGTIRSPMAVSLDGRYLFLGTSSGVRVYHLVADAQRVTIASGQVASEINFSNRLLSENRVPLVTDDAFEVSEDSAATGNILANDLDPQGDPVSVISVNGTLAAVGKSIALPSGAKITVSADGNLIFDTAGSFEALAEGASREITFSYVASDGLGGTAAGSVTVTVIGKNDTPIATTDQFTIDKYTTLTGEVLSNDSDIDGDSLVISAVNGVISAVGQTVTLPSGAKLTVNVDGTFAYQPSDSSLSLKMGESANDSFTYTTSDGRGGSATANVWISITGSGGRLVSDLNPATTEIEENQSAPDIAISKNGTVIVAWTHQTASGDLDVRFRRYSPLGLPLDASDRSVSLSTDRQEQKSTVSISTDGSFVIGYEATDPMGRSDVYFDHYDSGGLFIRRVQLFDSESSGQDQVDIAMTAGGAIVAVWRETVASDPFHRVYAQVFDRNGVSVAGPILVSQLDGNTSPRVAVNDAGEFIVASYSAGVNSVVFYRRFNAAGVALAEVEQLRGVGVSYVVPLVGQGNDGSFAIAYQVVSGIAAFQRYTEWHLFDPNGSLSRSGKLEMSEASSIDMDSDGSFVLGYTRLTPSGDTDAEVALYSRGGRLKSVVALNEGTDGTQNEIQVALRNNLLAMGYRDTSTSEENVKVSVIELQNSQNIGVARPNESGGLRFYVDSNGNRLFDATDAVFDFGLASDSVIFGDWNGDGIDDVGVARPNGSGGLTFFLDSNGNFVFDDFDAVFNFGLEGDKIVIGDWSGTGSDSVGVGRTNSSGGLQFFLDSNASYYFESDDLVLSFGLGRDRIVIGDWNGDGVDDLGVARANGSGGLTFYLDSDGSRNFASNDAVFNFGLVHDRIIVGDWNGDIVDAVGVARPTSKGGYDVFLDMNENQEFDATDSLFTFDYGLADDVLMAGTWE